MWFGTLRGKSRRALFLLGRGSIEVKKDVTNLKKKKKIKEEMICHLNEKDEKKVNFHLNLLMYFCGLTMSSKKILYV